MAQTPLRAMNIAPRWLPVGLVLAVLFGLGAIGYEVLRYRLFTYELTDATLNIESGVLFRREREIPLGRIQNVDMTRSIVQRALDITAVGIETAGGSSTEASLQFVSVSEAKRLQEGIRTRKRQLEGASDEREQIDESATGKSVEPSEAEVIFELDDESLVLYSLLSFDPRVASVLFVVVPFGAPFFSEYVDGLAPTLLVLFGLLAVLAAALGVWLLSAFARFVGYYGFTLVRVGEELRYERGLLQRYDGSIPEGKIQTVVVEENLLMRYFEYASLSIETAGYGPGSASGSESAVPLAKRADLLELARDVEHFGELAFDRPAPAAKRRYTFRYAIAVTVVLGIGFVVSRLVTPIPWSTDALRGGPGRCTEEMAASGLGTPRGLHRHPDRVLAPTHARRSGGPSPDGDRSTDTLPATVATRDDHRRHGEFGRIRLSGSPGNRYCRPGCRTTPGNRCRSAVSLAWNTSGTTRRQFRRVRSLNDFNPAPRIHIQ
ncbi:MAG: PH domain-containing protein [Halodesulfurarchaeum sp.]|nr:PH domain-containing protein [Halodesulfurarchaeum sp.]